MFEALFDFSDWGWRTVVIWLVVALIVYVLVLVLRMMRLPGRASTPENGPSFEAIRQARLQPYLEESAQGSTGSRQGVPFVPESADLAWREPPQRFAEQQVQAALEREVNALREEVDGLREAFSALREDMLKDLAALRAQQGVAAFYREAMALAASGKQAEDIAARCGIARAEADLVIALAQAREQRGDDDRETHG
jgi:hypothetical protein